MADANKTKNARPARSVKDRVAGKDLSSTELAVMKVFWRQGAQSAREAHEQLKEPLGWAYSTTRTMLERMVKKELLRRREFHGLYVYEASAAKVTTLAGLVRNFARRVLELDSVPVATLFAGSDVLSQEEVAELESLLEAEKESDR